MQDFQKKLVGVSVRVTKREREREGSLLSSSWSRSSEGGLLWAAMVVGLRLSQCQRQKAEAEERTGEERRKEILLIGMNEISGGAT